MTQYLYASYTTNQTNRERLYGTMTLWYCEILQLLCYDFMKHDTLIVWDCEWKRYWLYVALCCVFVCIWSTLEFSYCPVSFSSFVFYLSFLMWVFKPICVFKSIYIDLLFDTSSTAQGAGGSFKNRKPIGEIGCCESRMSEQKHAETLTNWLTDERTHWLIGYLINWVVA